MKQESSFRKALPSLIAVAFGLVVSLLIIRGTNPENAARAIPNFFKGPANRGLAGFGDLLYHTIPLLMTGLSVAFAFQTGLFNIGGSGQFLLGGYIAILLCARYEQSWNPHLMWLVALLMAGLFGGLLGMIPGLLKAYFNVNEVITCIMLNYTCMYTVNYLIQAEDIYDILRSSTVPLKTAIPRMGIDKIFPGTIAGGGIFIAIAMVILLHVILKKTTFGFELKGVGFNRDAARYAGINEKKSIILSMFIAGIMSGLAGGLVYLSGSGTHLKVVDVLPQEGFDGIAVALLGLNEPIGVLLSALFFAYLKMGGQAIQTLGYSPELVDIIVSIILYVSALSLLFNKILGGKKKDDKLDLDRGGPKEKSKPRREAEGGR